MKISKKTRDLLAYIVGGTIVLIGTLLLIAIATGWTYDLKTGELRETGLLLMGSEPSGATISVDGKSIKQKTNYRYSNVIPGNYRLRYEKANYRPWNSLVTVDPAEVTFADYAWLLPNEIPQRPRYQSTPIIQAAQSPDRRRFVFVEQTAPTTDNPLVQPRLLTSTDLARPPVALYTPPAVNATSPRRVASYSNLTLSNDNGQLLVRVTYTDKVSEWLVMPATPSDNPKITNLTTELLINPSWLSWGPRGGNELYYTEKGAIRRVTVNDKKISNALAENVVYAKWSNDWLIYITDATAPALRTVYLLPVDQVVAEKVTTIAQSASYDSAYFRTNNTDYLAVLVGDTKQLIVNANVLRNSSQRTTNIAGRNITAFTVSPNGRYLVHNSNDQFVTIDYERFKRYRFQTSLAGLTSWKWMNDQHIAANLAGSVKLIDFDGQNAELIGDGISPSSPLLFSDNKSLLFFKQIPASETTPEKPQLTQYFLVPDKIIEATRSGQQTRS